MRIIKVGDRDIFVASRVTHIYRVKEEVVVLLKKDKSKYIVRFSTEENAKIAFAGAIACFK